jgi:hypothetical protein
MRRSPVVRRSRSAVSRESWPQFVLGWTPSRPTEESATRFGLAALATWRVAHLLSEEDGPGGAVVELRSRAGDGALGELLDCFYCLSMWAAAPAALTVTRDRRRLPLVWLALSGAACLLERATSEAVEVDA